MSNKWIIFNKAILNADTGAIFDYEYSVDSGISYNYGSYQSCEVFKNREARDARFKELATFLTREKSSSDELARIKSKIEKMRETTIKDLEFTRRCLRDNKKLESDKEYGIDLIKFEYRDSHRVALLEAVLKLFNGEKVNETL